MKEKLQSIIANLKSVAKQDNVTVKIESDEIVHGLYTVDVHISKVKIETVEKMIRVANKYKECKTHEYTASKLRFIFMEKLVKGGIDHIGKMTEGLKSFDQFNSKL